MSVAIAQPEVSNVMQSEFVADIAPNPFQSPQGSSTLVETLFP